jgi:predicted small lipoprotein YifL
MAATLAGCGQKGPLFLPTEPAAANRASLVDTLRPGTEAPAPVAPASTPPVTGTTAPGRLP